VKTHDDIAAMAAGLIVDGDRWRVGFEELMGRIAARFSRVEPRRHARDLVTGLLAGLGRANCWTIAEHVGHAGPGGLQHLLAAARWDADAVRDDLRGYVVDHLAPPDAAQAVLVVDETGDVKKGSRTVGVQRQYTGTAGRVENSQVAVFLAYATPAGCAFVDRALYLPRGWTEDPDRMAAAGVPSDIVFATKPALARTMIGRALDAGVSVGWVTGDEVYGQDPALRRELIDRGVGYVLAVSRDHRVSTGIGTRRAVEVANCLPTHAWQRLSAGPGAKGPRVYDWAQVSLVGDDPGQHRLLLRRNRSTGEVAFYRTWTPTPVGLSRLVTVAGTRWRIEEGFQTAKELAALDQHQVRTWTSWHRWTTLALLAHAFLSVLAADHQPQPDGLIRFTRNEIRRLFSQLLNRGTRAVTAAIATWSRWRRRHQARAMACHYRRRQLT
jgi:SRSO17 transposase